VSNLVVERGDVAPRSPDQRAPTGSGASTRILPAISQSEWRWLALVTALILLLTQIPPTVERFAGVTDRIHVGNYWYHQDFSAYSAAMIEGARSDSWLIHNPASAEVHNPALMFPLYVTLGKIAKTTGLPVFAVFAAAEILTRILLPIALYVFTSTFLRRVSDRRFAFVLAIFTGGLTLFLVPLLESVGIPTTLGGQPSVQVVTFALFFTAPHLGLGLVMTLIAIVSFGAACRGSRSALVLLAVAVLTLALVHPFNLPTVITAFGIYALARFIQERRLLLNPILACLVAGIAGVPLLLYNFMTFTLDPFWSKTHGEANTLPSPRPWELPMDYGIVFILAIVGAASLVTHWRRAADQPNAPLSSTADYSSATANSDGGAIETPSPGLLLAWLFAGLVWMYVPLAYQHRLSFGLQPAMAVLAAIGWGPTVHTIRSALARLTGGRPSVARSLTTAMLMVLALNLPTTVYLALLTSAATNSPINLYTLDRDTYTVGQWLATHTGPEDVTIGAVTTGEVFSGFLPGRVVIARKAGTIGYPDKLAKLEAMYRGEMSDEDMLQFLRTNRVSYVVVGPEEAKLGASNPGEQLRLPVAERVGNAAAYRVPPA